MSSDVAISVENLSKCFHIFEKPRHRLAQMLMGGRAHFHRDFWALRNISFDVKKGETVGIVGKNGSGKSTLLQLICGTLSPTSGTISTSGRVAALLELGSGFNPEFTGRENIAMNATLLGLSKRELASCFDDIVAFADIGEFLDQPVKTYSSGMVVRLAFAVQAQIAPDILVVDEALAVGDARFQAKCFARLTQLKERGSSILLVSHSSEQIVTHCSRAILLDQGSLIEFGEPRTVVNHYLDLLFGRGRQPQVSAPTTTPSTTASSSATKAVPRTTNQDLFATRPGYNPNEYRWGDGRARILDFHLASDHRAFPPSINSGERVTLGFSVEFGADIASPVVGFAIKTKEGVTVYGTNSEILGNGTLHTLSKYGGVAHIEGSFACTLAPGDYFISLGVAQRDGTDVIPLDRRYDSIQIHVTSSEQFFGVVNLDLNMKIMEDAA